MTTDTVVRIGVLTAAAIGYLLALVGELLTPTVPLC